MFRFLSAREQIVRERQKREALEARRASAEAVSATAFVTLAQSGTIDEATAAEHAELFLEWAADVHYNVNDLRRDGDYLYRCIQAHTSQTGWNPAATPALWVRAGNPDDEYPQWRQPIAACDACAKGAKVSHKGKRWVSEVAANVWEPGVYGWVEQPQP